jgi:hypothetical protein
MPIYHQQFYLIILNKKLLLILTLIQSERIFFWQRPDNFQLHLHKNGE